MLLTIKKTVQQTETRELKLPAFFKSFGFSPEYFMIRANETVVKIYENEGFLSIQLSNKGNVTHDEKVSGAVSGIEIHPDEFFLMWDKATERLQSEVLKPA